MARLPLDDDLMNEDEFEELVSSADAYANGYSLSSDSGTSIGAGSSGLRIPSSSMSSPSTNNIGSSRRFRGLFKSKKSMLWVGILVLFALGMIVHVQESVNDDRHSLNNGETNDSETPIDGKAVVDEHDDDDGEIYYDDDDDGDYDDDYLETDEKEKTNEDDSNDNEKEQISDKKDEEVDEKNIDDNKDEGKEKENNDSQTDTGDIPPIMTEEEKEAKKDALIEEWGKWHFWDNAAEMRPKEDYLSMYPNKDCPYEGFPDESWQADAVYVNHMIDSASELVQRAKEAIYTEYGFGPRKDITDEQYMTRLKMFRLSLIDFSSDDAAEAIELGLERGGWTTKTSFSGFSRRLLHSMMTQDDFTVVMAGNPSAAGFGNHFSQSYMAQFDYIVRPILERMGVNLVTRNLASDSFGTLSNALGSGSIYGDKIDVIIWDSDIIDGGDDKASVELFFRKALLAGDRPPVLIGSSETVDILKELHINVDADVFVLGSGMISMHQTEDEEQVKSLPLAVRYLSCTEDAKDLCEKHKYNARCWIDRDDVTPPTKQRKNPDHQMDQNPGYQQHKMKGRMLSWLILEMLADALSSWGEVTISEGHPLDGEHWHITDHYENIKLKTNNIDESTGPCADLKEYVSERVCTTPLQARTEFTPRANPDSTSIVSILKPTPDGFVPSLSEQMLYEGADVPNPSLMIPNDETDVHAIVINRRRELFGWIEDVEEKTFEETNDFDKSHGEIYETSYLRRRMADDTIVPGEGWELETLPGTCDGTTTGICGRESSSDCLLYGHMNKQGGLIGDESSGWLVMNLSNTTEAIIMLKFDIESMSQDFSFDYAIDNEVTSLSKDQFMEKVTSPRNKVDLITLLDNPKFLNEGEVKNIELGLRVKNCANDCKFKLTHVYWA